MKKEKIVFYFKNKESTFKLVNDDVLKFLKSLKPDSVDLIFADPPYFLSNGAISVQNGKRVPGKKGNWDVSKGIENDFKFHYEWIKECKRVLKKNGAIWISGTFHSIYQCGHALMLNGFYVLNEIIWYKSNAAPNISCNRFVASHENLIWARKSKKIKSTFNYKDMKNSSYHEHDVFKKENKQMRSLWGIGMTRKKEKIYGKHPTQKPLALLDRIILSTTKKGDLVLDPFTGSSTTGLSAYKHNRKFIGCDNNKEYLDLSIKRYKDLEKELKKDEEIKMNNEQIYDLFKNKTDKKYQKWKKYFINTNKPTNHSYKYFLIMDNGIKKYKKQKKVLDELDLILKSKENKKWKKAKFKQLAIKNKKIFVETILSLAAIRAKTIKKGKLEIFEGINEESLVYENKSIIIDWPKSQEKINVFLNNLYEFLEKIKLVSLLIKLNITLKDYLLGLEIGIATHGRKNKSGKTMEDIVRVFLSKNKDSFEFKEQYEYTKLFQQSTHKDLFVDLKKRKADFVVFRDDKTWVIETNFYSGGGSKIDKVLEDYISLSQKLNKIGIGFIWITDGPGILTITKRLERAYWKIEFILNISMLEKNIFSWIFTKNK